MTNSAERTTSHHPGMRERYTHLKGYLKIIYCCGVNPSPPEEEEEGGRLERCGLLGLSAKPRSCFPSSIVSPEFPRLVSYRANRVSRQASWLPVVISGGSRGCNLCQATWRFGLDWSFSALDTPGALLDTVGAHSTQYKGIHEVKGKYIDPLFCVEFLPSLSHNLILL